MNQRTGANLVASIRQRLLNKARETDRPFNEVLQYFAMERFLYRLATSPHADKFVLKGAVRRVAGAGIPPNDGYRPPGFNKQ